MPSLPSHELSLRIATEADALCIGVLAMQVFLETYATEGIRPSIAREVLDARRHPWIEFRADLPALAGPAEARLEGVLAIRGRERPQKVNVRREGDHAVALASIHQPDFGIRPYTAMLGALRVRPDVGVRLTAPWPD